MPLTATVCSTSNWGTQGGIYHSYGAPTTLEVNFNQARSIEQVNVVTVRNSFTDKSPVRADETFSGYGLTDFRIEYWNGSSWTTVQNVSNNNKILQQLTFSPVTTTKIRIVATAALAYNVRITEVEAWGR